MAKNTTKVRRVKAKDSTEKIIKPTKNNSEIAAEDSKKPKMSKYAAKVSGVSVKEKKSKKPAPKAVRIVAKPFKFIAFPFIVFGKYLMASWRELKLVRWPTRKETWKLTGAVIAFTLAFTVTILLLDAFFNWIFTTIIK